MRRCVDYVAFLIFSVNDFFCFCFFIRYERQGFDHTGF